MKFWSNFRVKLKEEMTYVFYNSTMSFNFWIHVQKHDPYIRQGAERVWRILIHRRELIRQHIPSFRFFVSAGFTSQSWTTVENQRSFDWISMVAPRTDICRASMLRNNETWYGRIDLAGNRNHGREKIDSSRYGRISLFRWKRGKLSWKNKTKNPLINDDDEI